MGDVLSPNEFDAVFEQHAIACVEGSARQFELADRLRRHDAALRAHGPKPARREDSTADWSEGAVGPEGLTDA